MPSPYLHTTLKIPFGYNVTTSLLLQVNLMKFLCCLLHKIFSDLSLNIPSPSSSLIAQTFYLTIYAIAHSDTFFL